jgi:hypothetical protein
MSRFWNFRLLNRFMLPKFEPFVDAPETFPELEFALEAPLDKKLHLDHELFAEILQKR